MPEDAVLVERNTPLRLQIRLDVRPLGDAVAHADTTKVQWRHGLVATVDTAGDRMALRLTDRVISFPASCAQALLALQRGLAADAGSLPGLDRADGTVLIRRLLREAVVTPVPTTA